LTSPCLGKFFWSNICSNGNTFRRPCVVLVYSQLLSVSSERQNDALYSRGEIACSPPRVRALPAVSVCQYLCICRWFYTLAVHMTIPFLSPAHPSTAALFPRHRGASVDLYIVQLRAGLRAGWTWLPTGLQQSIAERTAGAVSCTSPSSLARRIISATRLRVSVLLATTGSLSLSLSVLMWSCYLSQSSPSPPL